jgi:hypothetical protein
MLWLLPHRMLLIWMTLNHCVKSMIELRDRRFLSAKDFFNTISCDMVAGLSSTDDTLLLLYNINILICRSNIFIYGACNDQAYTGMKWIHIMRIVHIGRTVSSTVIYSLSPASVHVTMKKSACSRQATRSLAWFSMGWQGIDQCTSNHLFACT